MEDLKQRVVDKLRSLVDTKAKVWHVTTFGSLFVFALCYRPIWVAIAVWVGGVLLFFPLREENDCD